LHKEMQIVKNTTILFEPILFNSQFSTLKYRKTRKGWKLSEKLNSILFFISCFL